MPRPIYRDLDTIVLISYVEDTEYWEEIISEILI